MLLGQSGDSPIGFLVIIRFIELNRNATGCAPYGIKLNEESHVSNELRLQI